MNKSGYIYIISNSNFPGFYKVGVTEDISARLRQYQTASPHRNYKVEYYIKHPNIYVAEKQIWENMKYFAKTRHKEWFECDLSVAIVRLQEVVECEP